MDVSAVRAALADAVRDPIVVGLNALGYEPDAVPEPVFCAGEVEIDPNFVFGGAYDMTVVCRLYVSRADDKAGQQLLDAYLSKTGSKSVVAALRAARGAPGSPALGGVADDLNVTAINGYRLYQVGETQFFGAELRVRVIGS